MWHSLTRETLWTAIVTCTLCSFAFSERLNSIGIVLLGIHWLADKNLFAKAKQIFTLKSAWVMISFFLVYLIFFLFSEKDISASHSLESKLSFFLLPLFLSTENYLAKKQALLFHVFCIVLSLSFIYALANAYYQICFVAKSPNFWPVLNRMNLSAAIMHPGYYSNYFMFAIIYLFFNNLKGRIFFIGLFTLAIILLASRIVILFYLVFVAALFIKYMLTTSHKSLKALLAAFLTFIIYWGLYQIPVFKHRVDDSLLNLNNTDKNVHYSSPTASRRVAYEQEWNLIKLKPFLGYGIGSTNEVLRKKLKETGYATLSNNMNAHNQYFNVWISLGIVGFLSLLGLFAYLFVYFHQQKLATAWWFTLLVSFNLATDDMLEIQAGVVFFVLIWSLYLFQKKEISSL